MTHLLSQITIKNFKSIKDETLELSEFTPLVGYNNAGKSNLLDGIKWLLRKSPLTESSFYDKTTAIEIEGVISGVSPAILALLSPNHKTAIEPYISSDTISIKRVQPQPNSTAAEIKLFVKDPARIGTPTEWVSNPTGLDQALQALFPEPIHIGAMENAEEDVSKSKATTTIGKLLAAIIGPIQNTYGAQVQNALQGVKDLLDAEGTARIPELTTFDTEVSVKVSAFFPGVNIKIHIPTPELKEVFSKGTIKVFESLDSEGKDVATLGHGAQRSIQMALVRHLADIKKDAEEVASNTLLLIDEPELYLHPQAIEVLRDALKTLSTEGYQVVFSTHSPFMITSKDVGNTLLIRKSDSRGTHKRCSLKSAIPMVESEAPSQLELIFSLSHSSNILFSERVILAEGTTEGRLIPSIIHKVTSRTVGLHKTAIVSMGGSGNTRKAMLVLQTMDIPTKAIVDLDYVLKEGSNQGFLETDDSDVSAIKTHLTSIAESHGIKLNNGWPTNKESSMSAADAFRLLASESNIQSNIISLRSKMKTAGIHVWIKGTIEDHLGGIPKNEAGWARFNTRLESDSDALSAILPDDHVEISDLVRWLLS